MNKKLELLYSKYFETLAKQAKGTNATHPLLIKVSDKYIDADIRVMIVGQETDGWNGLFETSKKDIKYLMNDYYHYLYNISTDEKMERRLLKKKKRPFWNKKSFKFYEESITKYFDNKKVAFIWNNISKIGKTSRGKQSKEIAKLEKSYFNDIFEEEVRILKPNIIIFVTGNRTIPLSHKLLKNIKFEKVSKVDLEDYPNIIAVRTYHPNARIEGGKRNLKYDILDIIYNNIENN